MVSTMIIHTLVPTYDVIVMVNYCLRKLTNYSFIGKKKKQKSFEQLVNQVSWFVCTYLLKIMF